MVSSKEKQRRKQAVLKGNLKRTQEERKTSGPKRPLAKLAAAEEKMAGKKEKKEEEVIKEEKKGKKKEGSILARTLGKAIHKIRNREAKTGRGTKTGVKEHIWSKGQFDRLVLLGLLYYAIQLYYSFILGINVFRDVPLQLTMINIILAILILIFFFQPSLKSFIGTVVIILFYTSIMEGYYRVNLPIAIGGDAGLIISLLAITLFFGLIWYYILHQDVSGMFGVAITFLLETGFKFYIVSQLLPLNATLAGFLLYLPYWTILGIIAGSYTEGGASKFVGIIRFILIGIVVVLLLGTLFTSIASGQERPNLSSKEQEQSADALKKSAKKSLESLKGVFAPLICALEDPTDYGPCIAEKTKPKKELTEEELLSFSVNRKKERRVDLYFTPPDIGLDEIIFARLKGGLKIVDKKKIILGCNVNELPGQVKPEKTTMTKDNLNFWQEIECTTSDLKSTNDVQYTAQVRQKTNTNYPNYFIDYEELHGEGGILDEEEKKSGGRYSEIERKCIDRECEKNIQKEKIQNIELFRNKIINDYPDFETSSIVDDEVVYLLLHTDYVPIVGVKEKGETNIDLIFKIANMGQGEIVAVHFIEIEFPEFIKPDCDLLDGSDNKFRFKEDKLEIDWRKVKPGIENQKRIGKCELKINAEDIKFPDMDKLNTASISGVIEFEYLLKSEGTVYYG